jgi:hypothetical protein
MGNDGEFGSPGEVRKHFFLKKEAKTFANWCAR